MPDTRPILDIGSVIDAASRAFSNNRQGVLTRALLQQAAAREDRQQRLREAEAANNGTLPLEAARRLVAEGGFDEESPASTLPAPSVAAPPAVDANLDGSPGAGGQLQVPSPPQASQRRPKYTVIDLGNGFAQVPELTPGYRASKLLETRLRAAQDLETQRGGNRLAVVDARGNIQFVRDQEKEDFTTERDQKKHGFDMEKQQAALNAHLAVAQLRGAMKGDPSTMTTAQRISTLGKLADTYVAAAQGDPSYAMEIAENDPTLSEFGASAKQLQSFIAGSVAKWQRGETNANLRTQGQTGDTPEEATGRIGKTRDMVTGSKANTVQTQDEYDHLRNDLGWSDAQIGQRYVVPSAIKRKK